ncbi:hypothetical protein [Staphylococcus phage PT1-4]
MLELPGRTWWLYRVINSLIKLKGGNSNVQITK